MGRNRENFCSSGMLDAGFILFTEQDGQPDALAGADIADGDAELKNAAQGLQTDFSRVRDESIAAAFRRQLNRLLSLIHI